LAVVLDGLLAGTLTRGPGGRLRFEYEDAYLARREATPLSLSMPRQVRSHADPVVTPWLWGLLPDNDRVLARWSREFHVSASSPFALLGTPIGHDCAGAVSFVWPITTSTSISAWMPRVAQALGVHPSRKYESDGGPGPRAVVQLLRTAMPPRVADDAVWRFVDANVAGELGLDPEHVRGRVGALIERTPSAFADAARSADVRALGRELPSTLVDLVADRVRRCSGLTGRSSLASDG
jgi:HipA-like protein